MIDRLSALFWKAVTPDLVPDDQRPASVQADAGLGVEIEQALGGATNVKSSRRVALTRLRVELLDSAKMDEAALSQAGVQAVMPLSGLVYHLLVGLPAQPLAE